MKNIFKKVKKGVYQIDVLILVLVLIIVFYVFYVTYINYSSSAINDYNSKFEKYKSQEICAILINSFGVPKNWSSIDNVSSLGLLNNKSSLSDAKMNNFVNDNYNTILSLLGIPSDYILYINISNLNGSKTYVNFGYDYIKENKTNEVYNVEDFTCFSNYDSEIVKVFVEVWK
jgi:predicted PolB exonuclease-like 3'-5' exonuclease